MAIAVVFMFASREIYRAESCCDAAGGCVKSRLRFRPHPVRGKGRAHLNESFIPRCIRTFRPAPTLRTSGLLKEVGMSAATATPPPAPRAPRIDSPL